MTLHINKYYVVPRGSQREDELMSTL